MQHQYKIIKNLSEGHTAIVSLVSDECENKYALKQFKDSNMKQEIIDNEINILEQLDHPNILKLFSHCENQIILEFIEKKELFELVSKKRFSENLARHYFKQLINALIYLHKEKNIGHRDLKLENIMIDSNYDLKIVDFGFAKKYQTGQQFDQQIGTDNYMAPEMHLYQQYDLEKTDVFACGVILYSIFIGIPPFLTKANQRDPYYKQFINGRQSYYWEVMRKRLNIHISASFENLINGMLEFNPENRFTLEKIQKHPWLNNQDELIKVDQQYLQEEIESRQ